MASDAKFVNETLERFRNAMLSHPWKADWVAFAPEYDRGSTGVKPGKVTGSLVVTMDGPRQTARRVYSAWPNHEGECKLPFPCAVMTRQGQVIQYVTRIEFDEDDDRGMASVRCLLPVVGGGYLLRADESAVEVSLRADVMIVPISATVPVESRTTRVIDGTPKEFVHREWWKGNAEDLRKGT